MVVESLAIILIIFSVIVVFLRAKKKSYAIAVLPLTFVPFLHLAGFYTRKYLSGMINADSNMILSVIDIIALVFSCIFIGIMSGKIKSKAARNTYIIISGLFLIVLVCIFISDSIARI